MCAPPLSATACCTGRAQTKRQSKNCWDGEVRAAMQVAERVAQALPNGISTKLDGLTKHY